MKQKPELKTPPIRLFGDVVLLQCVLQSESGLVLPGGHTADSRAFDLYVVARGDGQRVQALDPGDRVELVHVPGGAQTARSYPKVHDQPFMLCGFDNILGVLTD